ncbi:MAG: primosomal protein N' [Halioglobus sp.]
MSILRLAVPTPLRRLFDYLPPADLSEGDASLLAPGMRFLVPFGQRQLVGYLISVEPESDQPSGKMKQAITQLDSSTLLSPQILALCSWARNYYKHPPGEVYAAAFPNRMRQGKPPPASNLTHWQLTTKGKGLPGGALTRSPKQAAALLLLQQTSSVSKDAFIAEGITSTVLRSLREKGLAEAMAEPSQSTAPVCKPGLSLNEEQQVALASLEPSLGQFGCHLLEGVTGSGKTEVYLQLIAQCLDRSEQALVLIPEIGLTPQTLRRFEQRFDARIAVFHSGLTDTERYQAWEASRTGQAHIILGTRSAIYTPIKNLGVIIVDEEHDASYKQQDGFRYSARDVAVKRAQLEQCPIVLGSATPSLESLHNADSGRYSHLKLSQRAGSGTLPVISAQDVRGQSLRGGLSTPLIEACGQALANNEQVLLFLNRRGYAPSLLCHDCGWIAECDACDARLTVHRRQKQLRCHHCNAGRPLPTPCPVCRSNRLLTNGLGTEQTEETLNSLFPGVTIHRVDSDSIQGRTAMGELVDTVNEGKPCILLGTQMLTKGHHFPAVSLIGVIDADALLFSADFRGEERMAQLLTQVAGRAGRANTRGTVMLQTHYPDHPAVRAMITETFASQARELMVKRAETGMPPFSQLLMLRVDSVQQADGERFLQQLRHQVTSLLPADVFLIGPLPSAMPRRAGKFRSQLMMRAPDRKSIQYCAGQLVTAAESMRRPRDLKWSLDIDPSEVM